MSRTLLILIGAALTAACSLEKPLPMACRTDDDCLGGSRCVALVCGGRADGGSGNDDGNVVRAPGAPGAAGPGAAADAADTADMATASVQEDGSAATSDLAIALDQAGSPPSDAAIDVPRMDAPTVPDVVADVTPPFTGDPCCVVAGLCDGPAPTVNNAREFNIPATRDFVPLCRGWIVFGDRKANRIVISNAFSGEEKSSFQLSAAPDRVLLDPARRLVIASYGPTTGFLAKVELDTGKVTPLSLPAGAKDIALTGGGQVLALTGGDEYHAGALVVIDEATGSNWTITSTPENTPQHVGFGNLLAYRPAESQVFFATAGLSPSSLGRAKLSLSARTLTPLDALWNNGSNCKELVLSEDGQHLAVPCGAGNTTPPYTIVDRSTDNLDTVRGEWATGAYPNGAAFSRDGKYFVASDSNIVHVFSVATHAKLASFPTTSGLDITRIRIGTDNLHFFALSASGADSARLSWDRLP